MQVIEPQTLVAPGDEFCIGVVENWVTEILLGTDSDANLNGKE